MIYHGKPTLEDLPRTVTRATATIRRERPACDFDCIVVTGMSGVVVGIPVGLRLRVPVAIVRKESDHCHSLGRIINEPLMGGRALFLDDFVSAGNTFDRVRKVLSATDTRIVAKYMYEYDGFEPWDEPPHAFTMPEPKPVFAPKPKQLGLFSAGKPDDGWQPLGAVIETSITWNSKGLFQFACGKSAT